MRNSIVDLILPAMFAILLTIIVCLMAVGTAILINGIPRTPDCSAPEPEIKLVYIYMMEVPYLDSDFRGLLHTLDNPVLADEM